MEQRLKQAVERIVRPIPLEESVKDRMREELWGHVQQSYESLRADGASEEAAFEEAVARLGDPRSLRKSLFRSQSIPTRALGWIDYHTSLRPDMNPRRRACELAFMLFLCMIALGIGVSIIDFAANDGSYVMYLFTICLELGVMSAGFVLTAVPLLRPFQRAWRSAGSGVSCLGIYAKYQAVILLGFAASAAASWVTGALLFIVAGPANQQQWLELTYVTAAQSIGFATCFAVLAPMATAAYAQFTKRLEDWPYEQPLAE